uniref:Uncharacterized protein n=1 Tax=Meloidogyne enterolobii TaxID=390850 RepID=A0A6V7XWP8_MELEN|nr:unnamed protein product [Meloidogyne enterolobii]
MLKLVSLKKIFLSVSASHHASGASSSTGHNYLENLRLVYFGVTEHFGEVDASYFKH